MMRRASIKLSIRTISAVLAVLFVMLSGFAASAYAANYYVAANGSDSNPGTISQPFLTIQKCASTAASGSVCQIRAGTYHETVTPNSGITISSYNNEQVTVDGTDAVTGWKVYQGSIYSASARMSNIKYVICANGDNCTTVYDTNQLFVGQQMMTEARWPNGDDLFHVNWATAQTGTSASKLVDSNLPNVNWLGAKIHFWSGTDPWSSQTGTVTSSQSSQLTFTLDGATFPPMISPAAGGFYYVFGTLGALDTENEWYYDNSSSTLYFWAPGGVNPNTLDVRAKQRLYAFDLSGKSSVTIQNLNLFACTIKTNVSSENNTVDGITAAYVSHYTSLTSNPVYPTSYWDTHTDDSGIVIDGTGNALKNSAISYSAGNGVALMGSNNIVQNNLIHHIDYMANDAAGVNISGTGHSIKNNTIYATGRDSVFIKKAYWPNGKETYSNNNDISYNNLFNAMMLSIDAGAIYTGGAGMPPLTGLRIHHNWIHDTQSWIQYTQSLYSGQTYNYGYVGVYLDMFAGGVEIDQNIFWNNQFHSIQVLSDGTGGSEPYPNNNNVHNNSIIDVSSKSSIFIQGISNCGSTQIVNNYVLVPVEVDNSSCTVSNNSSTATGANEMTSSVQVGCNFTGCSSSNPPTVSGGLVSASIATQPYSVTVSAGQSATFRVTGAGSPTLTYQWQKNGVNINGATSATYTTPVTTSVDNGTVFTAQVSNSVGTVTSNQATLTVRGGTTGYTLSVTKSGTGTGTVTASSGTLTWSGSTGTASYTSGTSVTLTAAASSGSTFTSWSGCDASSGSSCTVTMSAAKSVTAAFTSGISDSDAASAAFTAIYNQYASWFGSTSGGIQTGTSWIAYYQLYSNGAYLVAATDGNIYLYYNGQLSGLGAAWQSLGKAATKITAIYNQYASWFGSTSGSIYIGTSGSAAYYVQWFTNGAAVVAWTDGYLYTYYNGTSYALGVSWR